MINFFTSFFLALCFILYTPFISFGTHEIATNNQIIIDSDLLFGNLSLNIENDDLEKTTKAVIEFTPLSSIEDTESKRDFNLVIGNDKSRIKNVTVIPKELINNKTIEINYGKKTSNVKTTTVSIPYLSAINDLHKKSIQAVILKLPDSYYNTIQNSQNIILEYDVSKVTDIKNKTSNGGLHLYPLDKVIFEISFNHKQMVIASDLEVITPSNFESDLILEGLDVDLVKNGDKYNLKKEPDQSIIMPPENTLHINGSLKRYWGVKGVLTIGQIALALILGSVCGKLASSSTAVTFELLLKEFLPLGSGAAIIYTLHKNVISKHPDIPSIFFGGIPSIFDLFTLASGLLVFPTFCILAYQKKWGLIYPLSMFLLVTTYFFVGYFS